MIFEIAMGVFLGGSAFWILVSYRERRKQAKIEKETTIEITRFVDEYISQRFETLSKGYLDAFRTRLATIYDDPDCRAIDAANIEFELFEEITGKLKSQVATETHKAIKDSFSKDNRMGDTKLLNEHISLSIDSGIRELIDEAMLLLTKELLSINDDSLPSCTQGHPRKLFNLGNAYLLGQNVQQDYKEAVRLLTLSAGQGYAEAEALLGLLYLEGEGVEQNYQEALKWCHLAVKHGNAWGQNLLGLMYENGTGVEQDYQEALKWYGLSAAQEYGAAMSNLGSMYYEGKGVEQDYVRARMWFILSAERGEMSAKGNLDVTTSTMTSDQITEADELANNYKKNIYNKHEQDKT